MKRDRTTLRRMNPVGFWAAVLAIALAFQCGHALPAAAARIGGVQVDRDDVDLRAGNDLYELRLEEYELQKAALQEIIDERLLDIEARAAGRTPDALLQREVKQKQMSFPSETVRTIMIAFEIDQLTDEMETKLRERLEQAQYDELRRSYLEALRVKHNVQVLLKEPKPFRYPLDTGGRWTLGPEIAPIQLVFYSDYKCGYCKDIVPLLRELTEAYPDKVRVVYRQYPLDQDAGSPQMIAAVAAECAGEQGSFWAYHEKLYATDEDTSTETVNRLAIELGLESTRFQACTRSPAALQRVQADLHHGESVDVTGTPTFFINGIKKSGLISYEELTQLVDGELGRDVAAQAGD